MNLHFFNQDCEWLFSFLNNVQYIFEMEQLCTAEINLLVLKTYKKYNLTAIDLIFPKELIINQW